jgi:predicted phage replisome organizer
MEKNKYYYWFKLKDDFFAQPYIKKLRKIAGGDTYVIIYQKILLLTVKTNGYLYFQGIEKTLEEELALILDEEIDNVKITVLFMKSNNLLESTSEDKKEYLLPNMLSLTGSESESAERVRAYRERKKQGFLLISQNEKALHCNGDVTKCNENVTTDIDIDKDKDKDKRLNTEEEDFRSGEKRPAESGMEKRNIVQFNKNTNLLELSNATLKFLQDAYSDIDISVELKKMSVWLVAHPETVSEIEQFDNNFIRFAVKWLVNENSKKKQKKNANTKKYAISFNQETANLIGIDNDYINILKSKFLGINVETEIKKMEAWLFNNPSKRPAKDYPRFINRWLTQEQDKASIRDSSQRQFNSKNNKAEPQTFAEKKLQNSLNAVNQVKKDFLTGGKS